jgi:glucose-1-phosphate adenylyltransferase
MHFGADVIPHALVAGLPVAAVHGAGPWRDVSSLPDFYDAVTSLAKPDSGGAASLAATAAVLGARTGRVLPPCRAVGPSTITRSLISEGCTLDGAAVIDSVVGNNVSFGPGSRVEGSILLGNDLFGGSGDAPTVGAGATLSRVIVDRNATIGAGAVLTNAGRVTEADRSDEGFVIQDGLIVVLRGAVLPAGLVV